MSRAFEQFLYHGTIFRIDRIDVGCGRRRKDFGRGFYMAFRPDQAIGMMHKKHREAERRSRNHELPDLREYLYRIRLNPTVEERLAVKVFETADMEWLEFILSCRESAEERAHSYDIIVGPTADDDTLLSLQNYWKGLYGPVGQPVAKAALLSALEPENLGIQCCLCTDKAVEEAVADFTMVDWRIFV
jgi:hypothetical protein